MLNVTPNVRYGGIWMGGSAPSGFVRSEWQFVRDHRQRPLRSRRARVLPNNDYGDSFLELFGHRQPAERERRPVDLPVLYAHRSDNRTRTTTWISAQAGPPCSPMWSPAIRPPPPTWSSVAGGKDRFLYVLNRDSMGKLGRRQRLGNNSRRLPDLLHRRLLEQHPLSSPRSPGPLASPISSTPRTRRSNLPCNRSAGLAGAASATRALRRRCARAAGTNGLPVGARQQSFLHPRIGKLRASRAPRLRCDGSRG